MKQFEGKPSWYVIEKGRCRKVNALQRFWRRVRGKHPGCKISVGVLFMNENDFVKEDEPCIVN